MKLKYGGVCFCICWLLCKVFTKKMVPFLSFSRFAVISRSQYHLSTSVLYLVLWKSFALDMMLFSCALLLHGFIICLVFSGLMVTQGIWISPLSEYGRKRVLATVRVRCAVPLMYLCRFSLHCALFQRCAARPFIGVFQSQSFAHQTRDCSSNGEVWGMGLWWHAPRYQNTFSPPICNGERAEQGRMFDGLHYLP